MKCHSVNKKITIPASSAAVERLFSIAGKIYRPDRCRLSDSRFEQLMFIRSNCDTNCLKRRLDLGLKPFNQGLELQLEKIRGLSLCLSSFLQSLTQPWYTHTYMYTHVHLHICIHVCTGLLECVCIYMCDYVCIEFHY